ncbi:WD40-repeat-containing domain protein [Mycena galopus ATCC 62051]|nr:WD40-repeat-containing domain protein [Mycena galopus ATCC 62051]
MAWPLIPGPRSSAYSAPLVPAGNPPDSTPDPATDDSFSSTTACSIPTPRLPQLPQHPGPAAVNDFLADSQDPAVFPPQFKKEGSDWFVIYNPTTPRTLEVSLVHTFLHDSVVFCVQFSADGKWLATGCNRKAQIFNVNTGRKMCVLVDNSSGITGDLYIRSVRFSPDGKLLATGAEDNRIRIWDISKRAMVAVFEGHQAEVYSLDFSPDGHLIFSGSGEGTVRIWDMEDREGRMRIFAVVPKNPASSTSPAYTWDTGITSVAISPNGALVAAGCVDAVVRIWSFPTGTLVEELRGHMDSVYSVVFTRDGQGIVSGSLDNTLKYWDLRGGKPSQCMTNFLGHMDYVLSVAVSHDSQWFVSGSKDRGIQFWDRSGVAHCRLEGHINSVISVNLGPTDMLASGSGDCVARICAYLLFPASPTFSLAQWLTHAPDRRELHECRMTDAQPQPFLYNSHLSPPRYEHSLRCPQLLASPFIHFCPLTDQTNT